MRATMPILRMAWTVFSVLIGAAVAVGGYAWLSARTMDVDRGSLAGPNAWLGDPIVGVATLLLPALAATAICLLAALPAAADERRLCAIVAGMPLVLSILANGLGHLQASGAASPLVAAAITATMIVAGARTVFRRRS